MVRQIVSHAPTHVKPTQSQESKVSSAAAFAPLATSGALFGTRDLSIPRTKFSPSPASAKPVPSTEAACRALAEAVSGSPDVTTREESTPQAQPERGVVERAVERASLHSQPERSLQQKASPYSSAQQRAEGKSSTSSSGAGGCSPHLSTHVASSSSSSSWREGIDKNIRQVFCHFDTNRSGFINYSELRDALRMMAINLNVQGASELIRQYDENGDGKMDLTEFSRMIKRLLELSPPSPSRERSHSPAPWEASRHSLPPPLPLSALPGSSEWSGVQGGMYEVGQGGRVVGYGGEGFDSAERTWRRQRQLRFIEEARHSHVPQDSPLLQLVDIHALPSVLGRGPMAPIRLVRASFIIELWRRGESLPPRQMLPEEAFYDGPPSEAYLLALSCPWLTDHHPDPWGEHLAFVAPPLLALQSSRRGEVALFWDFVSVFQQVGDGRSTGERASFSHSLSSAAVLFAHSQVEVWLQTAPPPHRSGYRAECAHHARGLCTWEAHLTSLLKQPPSVLDLGLLYSGPSPPVFSDFEVDVRPRCIASRPPPLYPPRMDATLHARTFSSPRDRAAASSLYAAVFELASSHASVLLFGGMAWGEREAAMLSESLVYFPRLRYLDVSSNPLGEEGVRYLTMAMPPTLEEINLDGVTSLDGREVSREVVREARARLAKSVAVGDGVVGGTLKLSEAEGRGYDELFMVAMVGDTGTGKSCLRHRFVGEAFDDSILPTLGVDFSACTLRHRGAVVRVQVWDGAGERARRGIDESHFYRRVHGVVIVFDLHNRQTFERLSGWLRDVDKFGRRDVCKVLVGNKSDKEHHHYDDTIRREANKLAIQKGMHFFTTSARENTGIDSVFVSLLDEMHATREKGSTSTVAPSRATPGPLLRCLGCCVAKQEERLGPDEFILSKRKG